MKHADQVLEDEQLVAAVYEALANRSPKSRTRGRRGTPAEVVMRLLLLKHIRNWSYEVLEREVRANLVYRDFTRVGAAKAPDCKTMASTKTISPPRPTNVLQTRFPAGLFGKVDCSNIATLPPLRTHSHTTPPASCDE